MGMHRRGEMRIAVTTGGTMAIGRAEVDYYARRGEIADWQYVFPVQFRHRCVVKTADGQWLIMTPTAAKADATVTIFDYFPAADGSMSRV